MEDDPAVVAAAAMDHQHPDVDHEPAVGAVGDEIGQHLLGMLVRVKLVKVVVASVPRDLEFGTNSERRPFGFSLGYRSLPPVPGSDIQIVSAASRLGAWNQQ